jgi:hypothetical protein
MSQYEKGLELSDNEDSRMLEGPRKLSVFLPNQVMVMKELFEEA